jgi:hypothetical protein
MEHQLGLLEWVPPTTTPAESSPTATRRRATTAGLAAGVRIRVRSSETRSSDTGTITDLRSNDAGVLVQYRSDRNGGLYLVRVDRVRIIRWPRFQRKVF